ncbi:MAG: LacI family DNA-binding transcriptional regulator [Anaerolineae bacterium]|nr:LacI family DNA-binding transcriptional regulator [Anaerolineae bacterium]
MAEGGRARRVTMLDVAEAAGVSYQTVSRVINHHPSVKPETRARVLDLIKQLNYRPDRAARSLAAHRSWTLAVISCGIEFYGPMQMLINIEHSAREAGYDVLNANLGLHQGNSLHSALDRLFSWRVDGALLIASVAAQSAEHVIAQLSGTPLILIDTAYGSSAPSVIIDQHAGGVAAARHLIDLGHREIALICGPVDWYGALTRREGWVAGLRDAGIAPALIEMGDWTPASGYQAAARIVDAGARCTGLLVGNDAMALGAISALKARGLAVPGDVSVTGFDDMPESAYFDPPLTTVAQDFSALGRQGMAYLIELIGDPEAANGQRLIPPRLVVRASTAARA